MRNSLFGSLVLVGLANQECISKAAAVLGAVATANLMVAKK